MVTKGFGKLRGKEPIESAMREIKKWLDMLDISGLSVDMRYDARLNVALLKFTHNLKNYEFTSRKQENCRLNMWAIARAMEGKVRNHIMGIEDFTQSMTAYLQLENNSGYQNVSQNTSMDDKYYVMLGISSIASNDEIIKHYRNLMKTWHPDMALSEEAKKIFEQKTSEINEAWSKVKEFRGIN